MHGQVAHQPGEDVVFDRGVDWGGEVDEDGLGDEEVEVGGVADRDVPRDPAEGEDEAGPEGEPGYAPEAVAARGGLLVRVEG